MKAWITARLSEHSTKVAAATVLTSLAAVVAGQMTWDQAVSGWLVAIAMAITPNNGVKS